MRTIDAWFEAYGESHQNEHNKLIHWICIPLIVLSLLGLVWELRLPWGSLGEWANASLVVLLFVWLFTVRLSWSLSVGVALVSALFMGILYGVNQLALMPLWQLSLIVFALAWIGQFIGHKIEGAKPSFFEDLQFLLIGPLWLLGFIYRRLGIPYSRQDKA